MTAVRRWAAYIVAAAVALVVAYAAVDLYQALDRLEVVVDTDGRPAVVEVAR